MKQKHLTFEERVIIEEYLNKGISVHQIALKLGRPDSTVIREIRRNRYISKASEHERCDLRSSCTKSKLTKSVFSDFQSDYTEISISLKIIGKKAHESC